jgi:hypothetical protein
LTGALVLMIREVVESFQGIDSRKIHATAGTIKTCTAAFGAFIHQGWAGYRTGRKFSQKEGIPLGIVRLRF